MTHKDVLATLAAVVGTDEVGSRAAVKPRGVHLAVPSVPDDCGDFGFLWCCVRGARASEHLSDFFAGVEMGCALWSKLLLFLQAVWRSVVNLRSWRSFGSLSDNNSVFLRTTHDGFAMTNV